MGYGSLAASTLNRAAEGSRVSHYPACSLQPDVPESRAHVVGIPSQSNHTVFSRGRRGVPPNGMVWGGTLTTSPADFQPILQSQLHLHLQRFLRLQLLSRSGDSHPGQQHPGPSLSACLCFQCPSWARSVLILLDVVWLPEQIAFISMPDLSLAT